MLTACGPEAERGSDGSLHRPGPFFGSQKTTVSNSSKQADVSDSKSASLVQNSIDGRESKQGDRQVSDQNPVRIGSDPDSAHPMTLLPGSAQPPDAILPFKLRFPKDYRSFTSKTYVAQTFFFAGPIRADGSRPSFVVSLIPKQKEQQVQDSPESALAASIAAVQKTKKDWSAKKIEETNIAGIRFFIQRWSGFDNGVSAKMVGVFYLARSGDYLILLSSQDREAYAGSVKLAESAFATFQLN
jgi:hypothetical protein